MKAVRRKYQAGVFKSDQHLKDGNPKDFIGKWQKVARKGFAWAGVTVETVVHLIILTDVCGIEILGFVLPAVNDADVLISTDSFDEFIRFSRLAQQVC